MNAISRRYVEPTMVLQATFDTPAGNRHGHRHPGNRVVLRPASARRQGTGAADPFRALRAQLGGLRHAFQHAPAVRAHHATGVSRARWALTAASTASTTWPVITRTSNCSPAPKAAWRFRTR